MTSLSIPAPTDSYDHKNSTEANITSLKALLAAFDASMDSFEHSIDSEMERLDQLEKRLHNCRKKSENEEEPVGVETIIHASSFEQAIGEQNSNVAKDCKLSEMFKAKQSAYKAILGVLQKEIQSKQEDGENDVSDESISKESKSFTKLNDEPKPSDEWLDRPLAFELEKSCKDAIEKLTRTPLFPSPDNTVSASNLLPDANIMKQNIHSCIYKQEKGYYRDGLMDLAAKAKYPKDETQNEDMSILMNQSFSSGKGTVYTTFGNQSVISHATQGTAAYRRQQRKMKRNRATASRTLESDRNNSLTNNARNDYNSASRQHLISGSIPYVCELIHDTHGLGTVKEAQKGVGCFPPVEKVTDLFYAGKDDLAYSLGEKEDS